MTSLAQNCGQAKTDHMVVETWSATNSGVFSAFTRISPVAFRQTAELGAIACSACLSVHHWFTGEGWGGGSNQLPRYSFSMRFCCGKCHSTGQETNRWWLV